MGTPFLDEERRGRGPRAETFNGFDGSNQAVRAISRNVDFGSRHGLLRKYFHSCI